MQVDLPSARSGGTVWSVQEVRRLREFVAHVDPNLTSLRFKSDLVDRSLAVTPAPECPAYIRWPEEAEFWLGPLLFPPNPHAPGEAKGPQGEDVAWLVRVDPANLTQVDLGSHMATVLRPERKPVVVSPFLIAPLNVLVQKLARVIERHGEEGRRASRDPSHSRLSGRKTERS